jgi:phosphatidylglycerophosphate synthase
MMTLYAPLLVLAAFLGGALVYSGRRRAPESPSRAPSALASRLFTDYLLWLLAPVERRLAIAPNLITCISFAVAAAAALVIACGWYAVAAWFVVVSGVLDILDGHVARRTGRASAAGAFLDSVTDRWGELVIAAAFVFALRRSVLGIAAALASVAGAQMVSYTRARGEALGIELHGGTMQRPERIVAIAGALMLGGIGRETMWFDGELAMAVTIGVVGGWTCTTALQRLRDGMRALTPRSLPATSPAAAAAPSR